MTTFTIYANTNDHYINSAGSTYAIARAGSGTKTDDAAAGAYSTGQWKQSVSSWNVYQIFLSFDTSSVPAATPDSITLSMNMAAATTQQIDVAERAWSGGTSDFVAGASLSGLTAFGNRSFTSGEAAGYKDFTSGLSDISRTATYNLIVYPHNQQTDTAPTGNEQISFYSANFAGTTNDPKLTIVIFYKVTAATGTFTLTGVPALLTRGRSMIAAVGSFILTGIAAAMGVKRYPPPERIINFPRSTVEDDRTLEL